VTAGALIVGASQAGVQIASSLREYGYGGPITLVGAEAHVPYQRPPLSKAYLEGTAEAASLELRASEFYVDRGIEVLRGERVVEVHLAGTGPGLAHTQRGRTIAFDRLALAVGARPRRLEVPGANFDGVCYLRDLDDAAALRSRLRRARDVVVIGGGFIGLEAAAAARAAGKRVTVVEAAPRLIGRAVAPIVSEFYRRAHKRRGTAVLLGASVDRILGERGRLFGVELVDGTVLPADLVIVGIGVEPRVELARRLGLEVDGGIVVDRFARTSDPSVVAAGDCTVLPDPLSGEGRVRLESMPNAIAQGRVAAATLAGRPQPYVDVPWFWSDQFDLKLQIAGITQTYDEVVVRGDVDRERFCALYYQGGRLVGANAVNSTGDYLVVRKALATGASLPAERAARADVPLRDLLDTAAEPRAA
jgi:3-phenylpropionate/trans-cinnamate dioxygenase ferredoxin reductase subunit